MRTLVLEPKLEEIGKCLDFVENSFTEFGANQKLIKNAMLITEETMTKLIEKGYGVGEIELSVSNMLGKPKIKIVIPGVEFEFSEDLRLKVPVKDIDIVDEETQTTIRGLLIESNMSQITYKYHKHYNTLVITPKE